MHWPALRGGPRSIRFWLSWLVVACIVPSAAGAAGLLLLSYWQQRDSLDAARLITAGALTHVVDGELARDISVLQVLAMSPALARGDLAAFQDLAARALPATMGASFTLSEPGGQQRVNTFKPFGSSLPRLGDLASQRRVFETGQPVISGVFTSPITHRPVIGVEVPVFVNGVAIYSLEVTIPATVLSDLLRRQNIPAGWVASIIDQNDIVAARTQTVDRFVGTLAPPKTSRVLSGAQEGILETVNLDGILVRAAFNRSALSGWLTVLAMPAAHSTRDLELVLSLDVGGLVAILLLVAELARRISRRIARSIRALAVPAGASVIHIAEVAESLARTKPLAANEARMRDIAEAATAATADAVATAERYRLLADHANDVVARVGPDGQWRYLSPAAEPIFGRTMADLLGRNTLDFVHPDDRQAMVDRVTRLRAGISEDHRPIFRILRPDGSEVWIEASSQVLSDPETGMADGYVSVLRDVGKRVAAETALRESEERYRRLLESGGITQAMYMLDVDGTVKSWNVAAERLEGYTQAEIVGRNFSIFFTPEDIASGEPARVLAAIRAEGHFTTDGVRVRKDGGRFWARVALEAVRRDDGTLIGFTKMIHDITAQRIEQEQRSIIIEAAPNGVMIVNESGVITLANSALEQIFDYAPGTLIGEQVEILVPERFRGAHILIRSQFTGAQDGRARMSNQSFTGRRRDGSELSIDILLNPVTTPTGRIVVASVFDVSERDRQIAERQAAEARERLAAEEVNANLAHLSRNLRAARDEAEKANDAKSRFLAGITHELRTPLHGILGYAELMSLEGGLSPAQAERLEVMMASGEHLLDMINAVLDMSQIEADRLELSPDDVELTELVRICINVIRPSAEAKGLVLRLAPAEPLRLLADATRLRQVLINLLGNAVKFTPSGSVEVRLLPAEDPARIRLEVVDTGPGIWLRHRDKLFQVFERLNAGAASPIEGTGLGLAIAARIIHLMDGQIGYADNPCGGSVFWLELPVRGSDASRSAEAAQPSTRADHRRLRVLVADDEALNRAIARGFLANDGHEVVSVDNGLAAVEAATDGDFDVILMDVRMPGIDGLEATRRIRALPEPRGMVRIVAVTAQTFAQQIEMCRRAGMDSHISKPFKQATLLAAVKAIVPAPADPSGDPETLLFDRETFEDSTELMRPAEVEEHLRTLIARCEALLPAVRAPEIPPDLAPDAHKLAGGAGSFGFMSLSAAARRFEVAAEDGSGEAAARAHDLASAIAASLPIMHRQIVGMDTVSS